MNNYVSPERTNVVIELVDFLMYMCPGSYRSCRMISIIPHRRFIGIDLCDRDRYAWTAGKYMERSARRDRPVRAHYSLRVATGKKFGTLNEPDRRLGARVTQNLAPTTVSSTFHALSKEESRYMD